MPTLNTYDQQIWAELSYEQSDPKANLPHDEAFPPREAPAEMGSFREGAENNYYQQVDAARVSKLSVPQEYGKTDAIRYYKNDPIGIGFSFSNADLSDPKPLGYMSAGEMIEDYRAWESILMKKFKEAALYTAVSDNTNFESSSYYANAGTYWSSIGSANTKDDIEAGKLIVDEANAVYLGYTALRYALQNATFRSSAYVSGPARDDLKVSPGLQALADYWEVDYIFVSRGKLRTDSSGTSSARSNIWGSKALVFYHEPNPSPMRPAWIRQNFWAPMGKGRGSGGWFWNNTSSEREGGVGVEHFDLWNYYQFLVQEKTMAYRIDALYA